MTQIFDEKTIDKIINTKYLRIIALGNTFPYREKFQSWGWHWEHEIKGWVIEHVNSFDDLEVKPFKKLPGIHFIIKESCPICGNMGYKCEKCERTEYM